MVQPAMTHFKSPDVIRFLGKKAHGGFTVEIVTSFKDRAKDFRVGSHAANELERLN
jgi:hypothetical protein